MSTDTLNRKAQITLPIDVRQDLKITAGDRFQLIQFVPGRLELLAITGDVRDLKSFFGQHGKRVSIDDMNRAIAVTAKKSSPAS